jgi:Terminase small subunit
MKTNNRNRPLTQKQKAFALAYVQLLARGNQSGTEAARLAGYRGNAMTLSAVASENLRKPLIATEVEELRAKIEKPTADGIMSSLEVLLGVTKIAKASIADVLDDEGRFDLALAKERGTDNLIKQISYYRTGEVRTVRLYGAERALDLLGRYYKLWERGERPIDDPEEFLARLLKMDRKRLPTPIDDSVEGEILEVVSEEPDKQ